MVIYGSNIWSRLISDPVLLAERGTYYAHGNTKSLFLNQKVRLQIYYSLSIGNTSCFVTINFSDTFFIDFLIDDDFSDILRIRSFGFNYKDYFDRQILLVISRALITLCDLIKLLIFMKHKNCGSLVRSHLGLNDERLFLSRRKTIFCACPYRLLYLDI